MKREFTKEDTLVVKGMAILCLLFYHLFEHYDRVTQLEVDFRPLSMDSFLLLSGFGNICVAVFAFLSAYGIAKGFKAQEISDLKNSYRKAVGRYLKLTANFLTMFLSVNLLWFSKFDYKGLYGTGWQGTLYALLDATGLSAVFKTPTLNETWWYMELAVLIIFLVPLLVPVAKKMGKYSILAAVLLPAAVELTPDMKRYYFVILFGVLAAQEEWFEKLFAGKASGWVQAVCGVLLFALCIVLRQNYVVYHEFGYLVDAPVAFFFCWFGAALVAKIPGIRQMFRFLGKHSMNMYFVHTFFYMAIYQTFIYSFRYAGVILVVLAAVSLFYSVVLQGIKRLCGFDRGMDVLLKKF